MTEVTPSISYSPEGIFEARIFLDEDDVASQMSDAVRELGVGPGYEVTVSAQELHFRVAMPVLLGDSPNGELSDEDARTFIKAAQLFGGFNSDGSKDEVVSLEYVMPGGLTLYVHPHFQRWLNDPGLAEEQSARACIDAMASVFGAEIHANTMQSMRYDPARRMGSDSNAGGDFMGFTVASGLDNFRVSEAVLTPDGVTARHGQVSWQNLRLSTLGNCACMGIDGSDREIYTGSDVGHPGLYRWNSHNVDSAVQAASLLLGAASLAHTAGQYAGREDIFADVLWDD